MCHPRLPDQSSATELQRFPLHICLHLDNPLHVDRIPADLLHYFPFSPQGGTDVCLSPTERLHHDVVPVRPKGLCRVLCERGRDDIQYDGNGDQFNHHSATYK